MRSMALPVFIRHAMLAREHPMAKEPRSYCGLWRMFPNRSAGLGLHQLSRLPKTMEESSACLLANAKAELPVNREVTVDLATIRSAFRHVSRYPSHRWRRLTRTD